MSQNEVYLHEKRKQYKHEVEVPHLHANDPKPDRVHGFDGHFCRIPLPHKSVSVWLFELAEDKERFKEGKYKVEKVPVTSLRALQPRGGSSES